ncbi:MAG: helix-turn-helix domain-containing protein [Desulfobacterales bacterium]|jgi:transposase-like protein|nr:helix-turn-helix domain-containing protein [Desulfobacterales bacterium]
MDHATMPESPASTENATPKGVEATGKRNTYSGAFKAKVVSEFINKKGRLKELAEHYQLHPNQIKNWKSILLKRAGDILEDKRRSKA